jgi:hypothetical protein
MRLRIPYSENPYRARFKTEFIPQQGPLLEFATNIMPLIDPVKVIQHLMKERDRKAQAMLNLVSDGI